MAGATRIVLTREHNRNREWSRSLRQAGIAVLELPLLVYAPLTVADLDPASFHWLVFTSPQAVAAFGKLVQDPGPARCAVLGDGTAAAVTARGWPVAFNASAHDGAEFVAAFLQRFPGPGNVLLPGPKRRLKEPRASLAAAGYDVRELPLYETRPADPAGIAAADLATGDVVFFCSPSAVRAFTDARADKPRCVAIGETTAQSCRQAGFAPAVADTPDLESMVRAAGLGDTREPGSETVTPEMES